LIRDHLTEYTTRREQVDSYSEDKCDDEFLYLDEVFQDDLDTHTPPNEKDELYCEDVCEVDEPLFLDILFKDECDYSGGKICVKDVKSRVLLERRKLDLSIFKFNKPTNDLSFENITQEPPIDKSFKKPFEDELDYLDQSISDALVSYIPLKDMVNSSLEEVDKEKFKILGTHIVYAPNTIYNEDEFRKSGGGKNNKRKLRKVMNKLDKRNTKLTKRLTSPIPPLKRTHWDDGKRARGKKLRKSVTSPLLHFISCIHTFHSYTKNNV